VTEVDTAALQTKNRETRGNHNIQRREIFIWAAVILLLNQLLYQIKGDWSASLERLVYDLGAIGIFQLMAWYVVFGLLRDSDPISVARWRDLIVTAALCLLLLLPMSRVIWVAALGIAIYLFLFNNGDPRLRAAATVLAGLAVQQYWGRIFFNIVAFPLLRAETTAVGTILAAVRPGTTVWQDNMITGPDGFGIVVYDPCSSFHNVSLAVLCWLTVSRWRLLNQWRRDLVMLGVVTATMILLNLVRLCLMAWTRDLYDYWHAGAGTNIFAVTASLIVLLIALHGSRPAKQPA
jgi:exosortase/archaeosortase family protein